MTYLPFLPMFHDALREGRKVCTARSKRYGERGDVVDSPAGPLRLLQVSRVPLGAIRDGLWREEGCASPAEFEGIWCELHPKAGFDSRRMVWLHLFERVQATKEEGA